MGVKLEVKMEVKRYAQDVCIVNRYRPFYSLFYFPFYSLFYFPFYSLFYLTSHLSPLTSNL